MIMRLVSLSLSLTLSLSLSLSLSQYIILQVTIVSPMSPLRLPVAIKSARRDITRGSENTSPTSISIFFYFLYHFFLTEKATLADALNEVTSENKDDADNEIILEQALNEVFVVLI